MAAGLVSRERRKTVTVLFCDVAGSTALGERLEPETFRRVMGRYFGVARRLIEDHGGVVEKFIGDAVMAVFGVPAAHEDDALRAVRAAAALRDEIGSLNEGLEAGFGVRLSVRIGVNTGQVVAGTDERLAAGDAVNVAARLEQAAAPGEVIIGPQTWRLVRAAVTAEPLEPLPLKGKSQLVAAYRLLEVGSALDPVARRAGGPFVGRDSELQLLREAFAGVVAQRSCGLVTVAGMAGVGKSRLAAEALRGLEARVLTGRCLPYGQGITYWPVVSMLGQLLDAKRGCAAAAALMAGDVKVAAAISVLLGERAAISSPTEIAWAVRRLFESSAVAAPLVVVFDDLQWAEPALLDLVAHIGQFSRDAPILILCLARPELLGPDRSLGGGMANATTVLLEPLEPAATAALIDQLLPHDAGVDRQLRAHVRSASAGNPLFVEEMLALISESGGRDLAVPATIQALLAARLDQLPPGERTVLDCGSVEGESFHSGTVRILAPEARDVPGQLLALIRKDLLRPDEPVLSGEEAFRFRHLLLRDAAYEALAKTDRAELHERFARWLEQRGTGLAELDAITGFHLEQAVRYRRELAPVNERARRLSADAAAHLEAAGRRAMARGDTVAAVNLLERSEALLPAQQLNLALQQSMIEGLAMSGRLDDAVSRAARIATACTAAGDQVGELRARLLEVVWRLSAGPAAHFDQLTPLVEESRPVIERSGDPAAVAVLEYAAAHIAFIRSRFGAAFTAFSRAIEHASTARDRWFENHMRGYAAGCLLFGPTPVGDVLTWLEQAKAQTAAYEPLFDGQMVAALAQSGRFAEARALTADNIAQMNERGMVLLTALEMQPAWLTEMLAGDPMEAERLARQGCDQLEQLGERGWLSTQACQLADALYELGRYQEAGQWAQRGLDLGGEDDLSTQVAGLSLRSRLLAREGDNITAVALAHRVEELATTSDSPIYHGDAALNLAEILSLTGDRAGAEQAVRRAVSCYQHKGATAYIARARRLAAVWGLPAERSIE